ncbi:hypothetical protein K7X08_002691 [Anisodus acutangulus]|uniref:Uncharacterized protein n=1 Tax=Anisodus acutangulus TaxID=402998 RepID=A0A9Q1QTD9_9SOLA|nr:hypothetical protein K7X08_002691 [Anisodus acutangulus]
MAMQKWKLAFTVYGSSNSSFFVVFITKNAMRMDAGFTRCGLSNSRFFVPFIAKNGDAYGRWLYKGVVHPIAASLSLSLPRMAMRMDVGFTKMYGLSNNRFFVPFIAKNDDGEVDVGFFSVCFFSVSLQRTAMQKWTLAFTVCGLSNSHLFLPFIAKNGDAYGRLALTKCVVHPIAASLSFSMPRMAMRMDAGFKDVVCPVAASLSISLPRMAMRKWTLAL